MFEKVTIIDGGLASTIQLNGFDVDSDPLWSAKLLHENQDAIYDVHLEFLEAGADVIITGSYQASIEGFQKYLKISKEDAMKLIEKSVIIARKAEKDFRSRIDRDTYVAGSAGPYGACLSDGSEYSGTYVNDLSEEELMDWHKPRVETLISSGVDIIAFETFPALKEAIAVLKLLKNYPNCKCWVCFSCKDNNKTNYGDDFGDAVKQCYSENPDQLQAIGINCTNPSYLTELLSQAAKEVPPQKLPRIVYPNSGEIWTEKKWSGNNNNFLEVVKSDFTKWLNFGVRGIGGCCRVTPHHIQELSGHIKNNLL
ncbi:UNVERIFIED_CONTAM: hypothetical protein RMT77_006573 [Armadillidium vulgare]